MKRTEKRVTIMVTTDGYVNKDLENGKQIRVLTHEVQRRGNVISAVGLPPPFPRVNELCGGIPRLPVSAVS